MKPADTVPSKNTETARPIRFCYTHQRHLDFRSKDTYETIDQNFILIS